MSTCPTIKIKPSHPSQGAFVEVNAGDFNSAVHEKYEPLAPPPPAPPEKVS